MQHLIISFTDTEFEAAIACAKSRLVVVSPGLTMGPARALAAKWLELGVDAVQIVLDLDPEICRLGYGEVASLELLQSTAERLGVKLSQQKGIRVGLLISDETTTVFAPTPLLIEAGGEPGEHLSAIRLGETIVGCDVDAGPETVRDMNLTPAPISRSEVQKTSENLAADPPLRFDVSQKINVFNAKFEFVEFEMRGLSIAQKKVSIPSDLLGLGRDPNIQQLLQSTFRLIGNDGLLSGGPVSKLKQAITKKYLSVLPGYGPVIVRSNKTAFEASIRGLERYISCFKKKVKDTLQSTMDNNMEKLLSALMPGVIANQPRRWRRFGENLSSPALERLVRSDLKRAFGTAEELFEEMTVKVTFKGVTYELLRDPVFMTAAHEAMPNLGLLHDEFEAAKAEQLNLEID